MCSKEKKEKMKRAIVDQVNPKLIQFNKPLLLALLIGGVTCLSVLAIFLSIILVDCPIMGASTTANFGSFEELEMKDPGYNCLEMTLRLEGDILQPCTVDGAQTQSGKPLSDGDYCKSSKTQYPETWKQAKNRACGLKGSDSSSRRLEETKETKSYARNEGQMVYVYYRSCPRPLTAFGSALGYASLIEFGATIVIVSVLLKLKVVKSPGKSLNEILKELVDEEDTEKSGNKKNARVERTPASLEVTVGIDA